MESKTEIANLALSHLAIGKEIADIENEASQEAKAIRAVYDAALKKTLRSFPWSFATVFRTLALVTKNPTTEWGFSYRYPSDCLSFKRILSGTRTDSQETLVSFKIGQDAAGRLIYTDIPTAVAEFIALSTDVSQFPADFALAFSFQLASLAAPRLTGGDPNKLGARAQQMFMDEIAMARASAFNEETPDEDPISSFESARL